jgi:hypothetical protein
MKSKIENYLTIERARELFEMRGSDVVWRVSRSNVVKQGSVAGVARVQGATTYRRVGIKCLDGRIRKFPVSVISFALDKGFWPTGVVDHRDRNGLNNSPTNLRDTTQSQNMLNSCRSKKTTTGVKGVYINKNNSANPYVAQLRLNRALVFKEAYPTLEEATVAVRAARELHHGEFCNHG